MKNLAEFCAAHISDDPTRLILDRRKWPEIDIEMAVNSIESRRKLKGKVQEWHDNPSLVFPLKLSAEQCSSSNTARYKADLAEKIAGNGFRIADLTGGLGVDSWFFSHKASAVLYNEMQPVLCKAARYNFSVLKSANITISNHSIVPASGISSDADISAELLLTQFQPDIIFIDPARRNESGKKVFLIEDCTPDILTLKDEIFKVCSHILVKLSPMADISMACNRLGSCCREVHIISSEGECKELLIWLDREWDGEYDVSAIEIHTDGSHSEFRFHPSEERSDTCYLMTTDIYNELKDDPSDFYLFEPGKSIMKAGAFNMTGFRFGLTKFGKSTHYYIFKRRDSESDGYPIETMKRYGKVYRILSCCMLDKKAMKEAGKTYPKSEVTARNIPMDTETLRKKLCVTSGDDAHIFGLKSDAAGNLLICTKRA